MQARLRIPGYVDRFTAPGAGNISRRTLVLLGVLVGVMSLGISSAGAVSSVPTCLPDGSSPPSANGANCQVDPTTVPQGDLALESRLDTPFTIDVSGHKQRFRKGAEVTIEHFQFAPRGDSQHGDVSGWHEHGGPVFVMVLSGTLTVYQGKDEDCKGKQYPAGTGFVEPGGVVHDARNEGTVPVDIYDTVVLPPGSGDAGIFISKPDNSNPECPFNR